VHQGLQDYRVGGNLVICKILFVPFPLGRSCFAGSSHFVFSFVTGIFSPVIAASGLAVAGLGEIIQAEMKRREFRKKVPMSVFIDLGRK